MSLTPLEIPALVAKFLYVGRVSLSTVYGLMSSGIFGIVGGRAQMDVTDFTRDSGFARSFL